jgi:hypothetical protein
MAISCPTIEPGRLSSSPGITRAAALGADRTKTDPSIIAEPALGQAQPANADEPEVSPGATRIDPPRAALESPTPSASQILGSIRKYRLDDPNEMILDPQQPRGPRRLGAPPTAATWDDLNAPLPEMPFADTPLDVPFYNMGFHGNMQRLRDAITQEFGFKTRYGTRVKCVFMVVMVACGWD